MPGLLGAVAANRRRTLTRPMTAPLVTEPSSFSGALTISTGGTYTGLARRVTGTTHAVTVTTSSPVVIEDSWIEHERGAGILCHQNNADVTVRNSVVKANHPGGTGLFKGRDIDMNFIGRLLVEHTWIEGGGGIYMLGHQGGSGGRFIVRYNQCRNIDGRQTNGSGGYSISGRQFVQFVQLNNAQNAQNFDIEWNEVVNLPGSSSVEDNINLYATTGTSSDPVNIHHNLIWGAYPANPAEGGYAGGGIMCGDYTDNTAGGWVHCHNNRMVGSTNYGIATYAGHDINIDSNRVVASNRDEAGNNYTNGSGDVGLYVWNGTGAGGFTNNDAVNNFVRHWKKSTNSRNDYFFDGVDTNTGNVNGTPAGEVFWVDELAEWNAWWNTDRVNAALTIGPTGW